MASALLATYPEVFAGGAIIAGLPYGIAANVQQALSGMYQDRGQSAAELGGLVRAASDHRGPWPRVSIWHGDADRTVNPGNADAIARQWLDVHGLDPANTATNVVDGHPHQVWWGSDGKPVVESYTIARMGHGTPLAVGDGAEQFGVAGAFALEAGISSSYHIAAFFGLTGRVHQAEAQEQADAAAARRAPASGKELLRPVEDLRYTPSPKPKPNPKPKLGPIDIGDVITRALTAAGLMK
jgi:poly(3-hydroxybutyrate) depolymerase